MFMWSFLIVFFLAVLAVAAVVAALVREKMKPTRELGEPQGQSVPELPREATSTSQS